jgi:hypothetical protein
MAATMGCAECHDHKFDPYSTRDFYRLAAFFADVQERGVYNNGGRDPVLLVPTDEQARRIQKIDGNLANANSELAALDRTPAGESTEALEQRRKAVVARLAELKQRRAKIEKETARTMITVSVKPRETRVLPRGNWLDHSGEIVQPGAPAFLGAPISRRDGRLSRLDLANWLVDRKNPLTARVFVNRLWKLMFGIGLSRSLDDMGSQGEPPTHPELLDWLAVEFIESGWDVKHMLRLMVLSNVYRQSSIPSEKSLNIDPQNRLLSRQGRWRLEAEFIRDGALSSSGLLVRRIGGRSVKPYQPAGYWEFLNFPKRVWNEDVGEDQHRRGLYTHWQRTFLHPSLLAFDASSREECCTDRPTTNTPKAALALLNDPTYVEAARALATRAMQQSDLDDPARIQWIWREVLSREATSAESAVLLELLAEQRSGLRDPSIREILKVGQTEAPKDLRPGQLACWTAVARAVLNLNEAVTRN